MAQIEDVTLATAGHEAVACRLDDLAARAGLHKQSFFGGLYQKVVIRR